MELSELQGKIIGVFSDIKDKNDYSGKKVKDIVTKKVSESFRMVKMDTKILDIDFDALGSRDKNRVVLASKLLDDDIILYDFSKGLLKKDIDYFKKLFKKIIEYNHRIILIDNNPELFLDCVDNIYVINNQKIVYHTDDIYDVQLELYADIPMLVKFTLQSLKLGVRIQHYKELDELLKAIYRIKS